VDFLIVGSSNAAKLSEALEIQGYSCSLLHTPEWKIETGSADQMKALVREAIVDMDPAIIILYFLNNSTFVG
jgi:hypothetical protein